MEEEEHGGGKAWSRQVEHGGGGGWRRWSSLTSLHSLDPTPCRYRTTTEEEEGGGGGGEEKGVQERDRGGEGKEEITREGRKG